jgi:cell cycle sensor histidine kinase DivJ
LSRFAQIGNHLDASMDPLVPQHALTAARHRAFVVPRLLAGVVMLVAVVIYFTPLSTPSALEVLVAAWLAAAFLIAYLQSRAGRHESAHVLSSLALTGLVTAVALRTGAIASFAAIWLVLVPMEAALSGSRRVVALASTVALGAAGFLLLMSTLAPAPSQVQLPNEQALTVLGIVAALLYATALALGSELLARIGFWLNHAEEDRYRLLARDTADVVTRHGRNGEVLFVSPAGAALLASAPSDLCGRGLFERVHVADRPAYLTALSDAASVRESRTVELRIRRDAAAPGEAAAFVWIEMRCWPLEAGDADRDGEVVAVMRDVSARKDQEHALEVARAAAEQASGAKSRFLATVSHELRTPLNAIIGFSEMLQEEGALRIDAKRRHDYAHMINESGHHLLSVVNDILDMSKIESGNFELMPEPVVVEQVIAECCELLALRAREAGVDLVARMGADFPAIIADKRALHQIMLNLLCNAVKFTDRGGRVTVAARAARGQDIAQEAGHVVITVEDTGVGIAAEDLARVGEPFFQARSSYDRRHAGTGLGVSIVKGLLALHAGAMEIESRVGQGTRVTVHLPMDCEYARRRGAPAALARATSRNQEPRPDPRTDVRPDIGVRKSA